MRRIFDFTHAKVAKDGKGVICNFFPRLRDTLTRGFWIGGRRPQRVGEEKVEIGNVRMWEGVNVVLE